MAIGGAMIAQVTAPVFSAATRLGRVWKARMSRSPAATPRRVGELAELVVRGRAQLRQAEGLVEELVEAVEAPVVGRPCVTRIRLPE